MVKYLAFALVLAGSLSVVAVAEAGRRHHGGCASCGVYSGGCPGGVCAVPVTPGHAVVPVQGAPVVVAAPQSAPAVVVAAPGTQPAPVYYSSGRRLFGWRR